MLAGHARARPDRVALADGDVHLTWPELARVAKLAGALAPTVSARERVLWLGQNSFRLQELLLACSRLGAGFCPANWRQTPDELAFVIDDLSPRVVVWQEDEVGDSVRAGRDASVTGAGARWLVHDRDGSDSYESYLAGGAACRRRRGRQRLRVLFVYTAAFAGRPNAAMLSNRALIAQALLMAPWSGIDDSYVFLNSGPLFHIGTFMPNLSTFVAGGTNVFVRRSEGDVLCAAIERERCTGGFVIGPMVDAVVAANTDGRYDLSSFRGWRGNAAFDAMVQPDRSAWGRRAGGYGQSEVMGMATFNLLAPDGIGTHGRPSPLVQVRVVGPDDDEVPVGDVGEIAVRGITVMNGYWNRAELNEQRSRGGWHHTNDLGRFEADGSFSFIGPKTHAQVGGREHLPGRGRGRAALASRRRRRRDHRRARRSLGAECEGDRRAARWGDGDGRRADRALPPRIASYKKPRASSSSTRPRHGFAVDYDELDRRFGGGGYPGGTTRSAPRCGG